MLAIMQHLQRLHEGIEGETISGSMFAPAVTPLAPVAAKVSIVPSVSVIPLGSPTPASSDMLNANRTVLPMDTPAPTVSSPTVPTAAVSKSPLSKLSEIDWKKHLPFILIAILILLILYSASRKRGS